MALTLFFFIGGLVALRVHGDSISERTARLEEKDLNYGAEIKELKDDVAHLTHQVDTDEAFGVGAATMVTLLVGIQAFLARRARMDS